MKTDWETLPLEKCIEDVEVTTKILKKNFLTSGVLPVISQEAELISGYWDKEKDVFKVTKPVVVYGDHTRVVKYVDFDFVKGADGVKILKPKEILDTKYLFYYLNLYEIKSLGYARHYRLLKNLPVSYPTIEEQKRIVKILDEKFEAIEKLKGVTEAQLAEVEELFDSRLNSTFSNLRNSSDIRKFGEVCKFVRGPFGGSLKKSDFKKEGFAVYEQRHAIYNRFDNVRYLIDAEKFNEMRRFELTAGDLIMSCSGTMGKVAIVPENVKKGIINQALLKLSPNNKLISSAYLKMWMESQDFQKSLLELTVGAAIKNVASVKILKDISLPVPDLGMQSRATKEIAKLSAETKELDLIFTKKIGELEELKKSYLEQAFSRKL